MTVPTPPPTTVFQNNAYFWANNTYNLGSMQKPADATIQVTVDYTQLSLTIPDNSQFSFLVDVGGGPPLVISSPVLVSSILTFNLSDGIPGTSYTIEVNLAHNATQIRSDSLIVDVPSQGSIQPAIVPLPYSQGNGSVGPIMIGSDLAFISTAPRFFVGSETPQGPNVMDQWYNPVTMTTGEFMTDGTNTFWHIPVSVLPTGVPTPNAPGYVLVTGPYPPYPYQLVTVGSLLSIGNVDIDMGTF